MNLPCKVIEDILPLYHDGVCSQESRTLVEEHLRECDKCKSMLAQIDDELINTTRNYDELKPLEGIRSEWIKIKKKALLKGVLITLLAVTILFGTYSELRDWRFISIATSHMEIIEISELSDGRIAFDYRLTDGRPLFETKTNIDYSTGIVYLTPKRSFIENVYPVTSYDNGRINFIELLPFTNEFSLNPDNKSEVSAYYEEERPTVSYSFTADVTKICIGTESDHIVIWERGMNLPAASEQIEEAYQNGWR